MRLLVMLVLLALCSRAEAQGGPLVRMAEAGKTRLVIRAPERVTSQTALPNPRAEEARKNLAASITDLATYLGRITGSTIAVEQGQARPGDKRLPILVAELGQARFGAVTKPSLGAQTFRVVARPSAIALYGESDLATSYAIYTLLDRLGCRWFMPGALGEVIPTRPSLALAPFDDEAAPSTVYRGIWYADADYRRRNRLGGVVLQAGHKLETWVSEAQRKDHPAWRALVEGKAHPTRLRWSRPELAEAVAASIEAELEKRPADSVSMSPGDGLDFDDDQDRALDAGDFDPSTHGVSITDRLLVLVNRVATLLEPRHPNTLLGLLAYVNFTRAPLREPVHRNVVPVIAPITYCRLRPFTDSACPGADTFRALVESWRKKTRLLAYYGYLYNLAETSAPNPMAHKWTRDMVYLNGQHVEFYQPESLPTFEVNMPALYLGTRLAFDARLDPDRELDALYRDFYGAAAASIRAYSDFVERAWLTSTDFAGGNLGYVSRFPPEVRTEARRLLEVAKNACKAREEIARVAMLDASLAQFEAYMAMLDQLRTGRLAGLLQNYQAWLARADALANEYAPNFAFGKVPWVRVGGGSVHAHYMHTFMGSTYLEADRIAREQALLTRAPLCRFEYRKGGSDAEQTAWQTTDVCSETWSRLGLYDHFGPVRYRTSLGDLPTSRRPTLWFSRVDGEVTVRLNGKVAHPIGPNGQNFTSGAGFLQPLAFDLSGLLRAHDNQLEVVVVRTELSELGGGGILGPVYLHADK